MTVMLLLQLLLAVLVTVIAELEMKFTKYPESVTAPVGDEITFECAVRIPGELAWRWRPVNRPEDAWRMVPGTSEREKMSTRLVMKIQEDTPNSFYQCVVSYGSVSLASIPARLSVARLDINGSNARKRMILVPVGNTVALHCKEPESEPPAVLSWWKDDGRGHRKQLETPHGVLVIHNITMDDIGSYGCTATNELSGQMVDLPETTYLRVQPEGSRGARFLEDEEYVGTVDNEGMLTMPVMPNEALRLWCGAVDYPAPRITWYKEGESMPRSHEQGLVISPFTKLDEGIYSCTAQPSNIRRSWKVIALEAPRWEDPVANVNASEGHSAHIACGTPYGQPPPKIHWLLNGELLKTGKGIRAIGSDLYIDHVEKRHASVVQCFACNQLGCAYDAAMLTVIPKIISDKEYNPVEAATMNFAAQSPKRHNRKNSRKHKPVLVPPSKPNVTRLSDESVMVSWIHNNVNHGLPILFFKVQYREVQSNSSNIHWHTENYEIPSYIYLYEILNLTPDRAYKFKVAAVYSNQDNKSGKSSNKFFLHRGSPVKPPRTPILTRAVPLSTQAIRMNWTWSDESYNVPVLGFYIYYRALTSAGLYEKVMAPITARSIVLSHLTPDTAYEMKLRAYTEQAPSDFSKILDAKTHKLASVPGSTTVEPPEDYNKNDGRAPGALVTAGGALGAATLLIILIVTLLLCRRAKRPPANKEKSSVPETGGANGYIPAKVPMTITANPMHAEGGDPGVEMSFLHNNNCGNTAGNDDTLPHARKNGPASRQYV